MGGEALQLLRILQLKDTIMEAVMSKVFAEYKEFSFVGQIVKYDGFWDLWLAICQAWYPLICLLRLADTSIGDMDKVKYYVSQIDRLLDRGLQNVIEKWTPPTRPAEKLLNVSTRNIDLDTSGLAKTEGLEEGCEKESGKYYVTFHSFHFVYNNIM